MYTSIFENLRCGFIVFTTIHLITSNAYGSPQSDDNNEIKFSKLLNEKSEFLRFTSIANTGNPTRFQNVYSRAEDVPSSNGRNSPDYESENIDFPESSLITAPTPQNQFVRIREGQLTAAEEVDGILTTINQKPITGRTQVTAVRQNSGKRLNISPVFITGESNEPNVAEISINSENAQVTELPENAEDFEVTTVQNFEPNRDTNEQILETITTEKPFVDINNFTTTVPRIGVTIFDNRTNPYPIHSSTPVSVDFEDDENLLSDSVNRHARFPDFEDTPTNLAAAESNQPARVNVRPASSGKDYEYEYIYYYYDDDDDDNSTTAKPSALGGAGTPSKADLAGVKRDSDDIQSEKFHSTKLSEPSNFLDKPRNQKSLPIPNESQSQFQPEVLSVPNPTITSGLTPVLGDTRPSVVHSDGGQEYHGNTYPFIPRKTNHVNPNVPLPITTQPPRQTTPQQFDYQNKLRSQSPAANQFEPPVLQFKFVSDEPSEQPPSSTPAPQPPPIVSEPRQRFRNQNPTLQRTQFIPQENQPSQVGQPSQSNRRPEHHNQEAPISRRTPSRRPQNLITQEPEVQQQQPPTTQKYTVPAVLTEDTTRSAIHSRHRFLSRGTPLPTPTVAHEQFQPPLFPSRESDPIIEVQAPVLNTTFPTHFNEDRPDKDNFARQKSINDLYALSRLHQLAINTKIPDTKVETRGTLPKIVGGFVTPHQISTQFPDDHMQNSESTTISSYIPTYKTSGETQKVIISTSPSTTTTTTTTTEEPALVSPTNEVLVNSNERPPLRDRANGRFRNRNKDRSTSTTTSTTETVPKTYTHNRFSGRRRNSPQPATSTADVFLADATPSVPAFVPSVEPQPQQTRGPPKNRFSGRSRPTTSTTEESIPHPPELPEVKIHQPKLPIRKPLSSGALRRRQPSTTTTVSHDNEPQITDVSDIPVPVVPTRSTESTRFTVADTEKRSPLNRVRSRPAGLGIGPIVGRPLRGGRISTTTTTTEHPETIATVEDTQTPGETVGTTVIEVNEPVPTQQTQETSGGIITQKISVSSSSTTSESAELPKRGSVGVLGRLRSRSKAIGPIQLPTTSTTATPDHSKSIDKKPSRLNGILGRRKSTSTSTDNSVSHEEPIVDLRSHAHEEPVAIPQNGVIVQVSSVVTETEEFPNHQQPDEYSSTTTQGSILNRLKSQRKPGSFFRKRVE